MKGYRVGDILTLQFDVRITKVNKDSITVEGADKQNKGSLLLRDEDRKYIFAHNNLQSYYNKVNGDNTTMETQPEVQ